MQLSKTPTLSSDCWHSLTYTMQGVYKNEPLCYISAPIKATEMVFIWKDKIDPTVRFEYKMDLERCILAKIFSKWFGASIS